MNRKTTSKQNNDEENLEWLAQFRDTLSPYWASRLTYQPEKKAHVLVLEKPEEGDR